MVEATEHRESLHVARTSRRRRVSGSIAGDALPETLMWPVLIEVGHILLEHAPQVVLAQDEDVV